MSDRYTFHEDSHSPGEDEEILGALLARHAIERRECHEETPLSMTPEQTRRLWLVLSDEVGPISASKILKRVQREV